MNTLFEAYKAPVKIFFRKMEAILRPIFYFNVLYPRFNHTAVFCGKVDYFDA